MYGSHVSDVLRVSVRFPCLMFFTFAKLVDADENGTGGLRQLYFLCI